jgi:UPF0716 protein FxsA
MFAKLVALFILVPLIEVLLLIKIGEWVGFGPTILLVVVTGFIGASLARQQGFKVWSRIQTELQAGRMPAADVIDGLLILIGGIVLLTPGLLTDLCGFALMIPPVRRWIRILLERRFQATRRQFRPESRADDVIDI